MRLFLSRDEAETIIHSDDAFAQVAYLKFKKCTLVDKTAEERDMSNVAIQNWADWELYHDIVAAVENAKDITLATPKLVSYVEAPNIAAAAAANDHSPFFAISETTAYEQDNTVCYGSIEEETQACMKAVQRKLEQKGLTWKDVVIMNVFVANMDDFGRINAVYKQFFDINPSPRYV